MKQHTSRLDVIEIASPCPADWNVMVGDDRRRFCCDCKLHVYNISDMTRAEAETLIQSHEGRLCGRYFRRRDGTIITRDCPVGLRAVRRRLARSLAAVATVLGFLSFGTLFTRANSQSTGTFLVKTPTYIGPLARLISWVEGEPYQMFLGEVFIPPYPAAQPVAPILPTTP